ncbi:hypothetical protein HY844_03035 [Candidatus Berkelbacteria bacterium]|nr:hypothetical protein [Candidatus Berkelbacteria bacterium]
MEDSQTNQTTTEPTNAVSTDLPIDNNPVQNYDPTTAEEPLIITQEEVEQATSKQPSQIPSTPPAPVEVITPVTTEVPSPTQVSAVQPQTLVQPIVHNEATQPVTETATQAPVQNEQPIPTQNKQDQEHKVPINNAKPTNHDSLAGIYPQVSKTPLGVDTSGPNQNKFYDEPKNEPQQSVIGVIGEVVGSTGIIMLLIMLAAPLYRDYLDSSLYLAINTIGFLASFALTGLGFLLALFLKGKGFFKFILFIFLLLSAVMYFGLNTSGTISQYLNQYVAIILDYYQ